MKKSRLAWLKWTYRGAGGLDKRTYAHCFIISREGKRSQESLCGSLVGKRDVEIVADAAFDRCEDCDYELRDRNSPELAL
jgi:hypothetical protein